MSIQSIIDIEKVTKMASDLTMSSLFSDENSSCDGNLLHTPVLSLQVPPVAWDCEAKKLKINSQEPSPTQALISPRRMADKSRQLQPRIM
jgi:hypothetical protein